jgi:hypothetical protein
MGPLCCPETLLLFRLVRNANKMPSKQTAMNYGNIMFHSGIFLVITTVHSNRITAGKMKGSTRIQKYQVNVCFLRFNILMTFGVLKHLSGVSLL